MVAVSDEDGYVLGNPDAPIKLVEYASYTCGACAAFTQTGAEPLKNDYVSTGLVSYELRNLDRNGIDTAISSIVRCTAPEAFHPLSDQVWIEHESLMGQLEAADLSAAESVPADQRWTYIAQQTGLLDFFASRGISREQATTCLADSAAVEGRSNTSNATASELNINSTPTFILNGRILEERSWADLEAVLRRAGAREE